MSVKRPSVSQGMALTPSGLFAEDTSSSCRASPIGAGGSPHNGSAIDVEELASRIVEHNFQNCSLLAYRILLGAGAPLLPHEEKSLQEGAEVDPERRQGLVNELALLRQSVAAATPMPPASAAHHHHPHHHQPSPLTHHSSSGMGGKRYSLKQAALQVVRGALSPSPYTSNSTPHGLSPNPAVLPTPSSRAETPDSPNPSSPTRSRQRWNVFDVINEQMDVHFRRCYEDVALRLASHKESEEDRIGPNRRLNKAIELQRHKMDKVNAENRDLQQRIVDLEKDVELVTNSMKRKEQYHKDQLSLSLREIAVLKEQLYRTYRDKNYVGKDVDLMLGVQDEDDGEDVSVDQLLAYRRKMRSVENQIALYKSKIKNLEEDVEAREQAMQLVIERQRTRELSVANAKKELDDMNDIIVQLEQQKEDLQRQLRDALQEIRDMKNKIPQTFEVAMQATDEEDLARAGTYKNIDTNVMILEEKAVAMQEFDKLLTLRDELKQKLIEAEEKARKERERLEAQCKAFEARALEAEAKQEDLRVQAVNAAARQIAAESHAAEVANAAAGQTTTLAKELQRAQQAVETLRGQNATLCLAFTNVQERLTVIKSKAGLVGYKQRSNEHHFRRAEEAIAASNLRVAQCEEECATKIEEANRKVELAECNAQFLVEDLRNQQRKHDLMVAGFQARIAQVESASRALLEDFNRLRHEHLRLNAEDAIDSQLESELLRTAAERLGSATVKEKLQQATEARRSKKSERGKEAALSSEASRQTFVFEQQNSIAHSTSSMSVATGAHSTSKSQKSFLVDDADLPEDLQDMARSFRQSIEAIGNRMPESVEEMDFATRKIRGSQLPLLLSREVESALITVYEPLISTLAYCVQVDADLEKRAKDAAASQSTKGGPMNSKPSSSSNVSTATGGLTFGASTEQFLKSVEDESNRLLSGMGLTEQREAVAWSKLRMLGELEGTLRSALERIHRVTKQTKIAPIDVSPLPPPVSVVDSAKTAIGKANTKEEQRQQELKRQQLQEMSRALELERKAAAAAAMQKKQQQEGSAAVTTTEGGNDHSHDANGTADTTMVHEVLATHNNNDNNNNLKSNDSFSSMPSPIKVNRSKSLLSQQRAPLRKRPLYEPPEDPLLSPLCAVRDDELLHDAEQGVPGDGGDPSHHHHSSSSLLNSTLPAFLRPRSSGSPPRAGPRLLKRIAPRATTLIPGLKTTRVHAKVPVDVLHTPEGGLVAAGNRRNEPVLGPRQEAEVESDSAFGNYLSLDKEYKELKLRMGTPSSTAEPSQQQDQLSLSTSQSGPSDSTPSWLRFKQQQRKQARESDSRNGK